MAGAWTAGNPLHHPYAAALELLDLVRIVGEQPDRFDSERLQRRRRKIVVAGIRRESESPIRLDRIESFILQLVCFQFIDQTDAAAFLRQIENNSGRLLGNLPQRIFELRAAVAALGCKYVSRETLRVHSHERRRSILHSPMLDRYGFFVWTSALDPEDREPSEPRGQFRPRHDARLHRLLSSLHVSQSV